MLENQGRRYPLREKRDPQRFSDAEHVLLTNEGEPESFEEAMKETHNRKWLSDMHDEMDSLHEKHTYELMQDRALEQVGAQAKVRRCQKSTKVQSSNHGERLSTEENGRFR